jgi:hypothetical protein
MTTDPQLDATDQDEDATPDGLDQFETDNPADPATEGTNGIEDPQ